MNSRRSFFKRCATAIAVLALAPQIAFSQRLEIATIPAPAYELFSFQDQLAEIMSQMLHVAKRNLEVGSVYRNADGKWETA